MNTKTLYISDLDGTLLCSNDRLSDYTKDIINKLIDNGVAFSYATARSLTSASVVTDGLTLNLPVIVNNGGFIVNPSTGERLVKKTFNQEHATAVSAFLNRNNLYPLVYSFIDGRERVSWLSGSENYGMTHYLSNRKGDKRLRQVDSLDELYKGEVFYFTCIGDQQPLTKIYDHFSKESYCNTHVQQELYRTEYWCEIMPKNATKANAILKLKELLKCDTVVCFGDAINDISMFNLSDECYAVANAIDELKEKATAVIGSNEDNGVARWLANRFGL